LPQPLLAAPLDMQWNIRWSSENITYGGCGTPELVMDEHWKTLGEAALWLAPEETKHG
jgi:maltooligosyltrehalose trehalohydrolase